MILGVGENRIGIVVWWISGYFSCVLCGWILVVDICWRFGFSCRWWGFEECVWVVWRIGLCEDFCWKGLWFCLIYLEVFVILYLYLIVCGEWFVFCGMWMYFKLYGLMCGVFLLFCEWEVGVIICMMWVEWKWFVWRGFCIGISVGVVIVGLFNWVLWVDEWFCVLVMCSWFVGVKCVVFF